MLNIHAQQRQQEEVALEIASWVILAGLTKLRHLKYATTFFKSTRNSNTLLNTNKYCPQSTHTIHNNGLAIGWADSSQSAANQCCTAVVSGQSLIGIIC